MENFRRFHSNHSTISQSEIRQGDQNRSDTKIVFPTVILCADSMHSANKINSKYPFLTYKMVEKLYGHEMEGMGTL